MAEEDQAQARRHGGGWRHVFVGLGVCAALLIILHRPILLAIGRQIALRYAAKENLKIDFVLEGNPFTRLTARNFHAFPTGPSAVESIDIDQLHVDYDLFGFWRHGISRLFDNVEARSARVVLNPSKALLRTRPPKPHLKLPKFFPERIRSPRDIGRCCDMSGCPTRRRGHRAALRFSSRADMPSAVAFCRVCGAVPLCECGNASARWSEARTSGQEYGHLPDVSLHRRGANHHGANGDIGRA